MGAANQEILENIFKVKEHIPVFIGDFGDDPYCNVKNENAVHFENTDFTFCVRGKRKLKKYDVPQTMKESRMYQHWVLLKNG